MLIVLFSDRRCLFFYTHANFRADTIHIIRVMLPLSTTHSQGTILSCSPIYFTKTSLQFGVGAKNIFIIYITKQLTGHHEDTKGNDFLLNSLVFVLSELRCVKSTADETRAHKANFSIS